jgi:hypothetical protein
MEYFYDREKKMDRGGGEACRHRMIARLLFYDIYGEAVRK